MDYSQQTGTTKVELTPSLNPIGSVILLHGLGADGFDFVPIVKELELPTICPLRFIFPHAPLRPVTINNGYVMRAWYDIYTWSLNQRVDEQGMEKSVSLVHELIKKEEERGIPTDKIILAGFSQGAAVALATGLSYPKKIAGILAMSGYLYPSHNAFAKENTNTPIFLAHGTEDHVVPYFLGLQSFEMLKKLNYPVEWHHYPVAHTVCPEEIADIAKWLVELVGCE